MSAAVLQIAVPTQTDEKALFRRLCPVVKARAARMLRRRSRGASQHIYHELGDMTQEVFIHLFAQDYRVLRSWEPSRGLSLENFVGLVAENHLASLMRSNRRNPRNELPHAPEDVRQSATMDACPEHRMACAELVSRLQERVAEEVSPKGMELFRVLFVEGRSVESVSAEYDMRPDAVYAWRSRLAKVARRVLAELDAGDSSNAFRKPIH